MKTEYSLREWYGKYLVVCKEPFSKPVYLQSVRNGATVWWFDPLYARPYSYKTALRHLHNLQASELQKEV